MQRIVINQLGPISHCEMEIKDFLVLTGPQASGKSTIAKSVFFFKNVKNLLYTQIRKRFTLGELRTNGSVGDSAEKKLKKEIYANFQQVFGPIWSMDPSMHLEYYYTEKIFIGISLISHEDSPNDMAIALSPDLQAFLLLLDRSMEGKIGLSPFSELEEIRGRIQTFFEDNAEIVYIPAGRSMITLLGVQLNYIYSSMDDAQKRNLDYCTQNYLERILQIKPSFSVGMEQLVKDTMSLSDVKADEKIIRAAMRLMKKILEGEYRSIEGEERLQVSEDQYVKINFASSGQQEAVWILNVLFYYLLNSRKTYFIIEEPESHLFPNAQKLMTEFIALAQCNQNQILITTHSPYILGTINNLLYAGRISRFVDKKELEEIVEEKKWILFSNLEAFFMEDGQVKSCTDEEAETIKNEVIDGASEKINKDFDRMVLLKEKTLERKGI